MNISVDIGIRDLLTQILENTSVHSLLYFIGEVERIPNAEEWANACVKLSNKEEL